MFCALLGQDIRRAFTGPMVLWLYFIGKETCFPRCCPNNPKTRHCTVVQDREEAHCHRADNTMGDKV